MEYWGYHLILDCKNGDLEKVKSPDNIKSFVKELVKEIDMIAWGDPKLEHFATHNVDAAGYSLVQLIETSSITGHFVDKNGDSYIDIFSCKEYNTGLATGIIVDFFSPKEIRMKFVERGRNE